MKLTSCVVFQETLRKNLEKGTSLKTERHELVQQRLKVSRLGYTESNRVVDIYRLRNEVDWIRLSFK